MQEESKENRFINVLESHKGILYKVASSFCRDETDRDDLVHEIIFEIWRSLDRYDARTKYSTWIYRISLNIGMSWKRRESRRPKSINSADKVLLLISDGEQNHENDTAINQLHEFIRELRELDRAIILLYLEEKPYREIATILGLSETNISTRISRIKTELKKKFQHEKKKEYGT